MTGTSESSTESVAVVAAPSGRPSRLNQVAAWVGIVAGIVFIVAVVFFSGFCAGAYSTGGGNWHGGYRHQQWQQGPGGMMGPGPMGSGGMMGPGPMGSDDMMGPGRGGPRMTGPGMVPGQSSPTPAPQRP